jgi:hypothetical protein
MHTNHNDHPQAEAPLTAADLAAIAARHRAATPGPWGWTDIADSTAGWQGPDLTALYNHKPDTKLCTDRRWQLSPESSSMLNIKQIVVIPEVAHTPMPRAGDATFLAHSWEDVRRLLATVQAQQEEIARLREQVQAARALRDEVISTVARALADCLFAPGDGRHGGKVWQALAELEQAIDHRHLIEHWRPAVAAGRGKGG